MNPKNLNDERELDAWLAQTLRSRSDYIDDAGFTDGVMDRLPAGRSRRLVQLLWVLLAVSLAGLLGLMLIPVHAWAYGLAANLLAVSMTTLLQGGLLVSAALVVGAAYWVWQES